MWRSFIISHNIQQNSMLAYLPSFQGLLEHSKALIQRQLSNFTDFLEGSHQELPKKDNTNDITMASENKSGEDSYLSSKSREDKPKNSKLSQRQQSLTTQSAICSADQPEKSHQSVSYFDARGSLLSEREGKQLFSEQTFSRKRRRQYQVESFEDRNIRHLRKYISNQWVPQEREEKYAEINLLLSRQSNMPFSQRNEQVTKVIFRKKAQSISKAKNFVHFGDLPSLGSFQINYSQSELETMTYGELRCVFNLSVENEWGRIDFLEPVDLYKKDLDRCMQMTCNSVKVMDKEWRSKRIRLVIHNKTLINEQNLQKIKECARALGLTSTFYHEYSGNLSFNYSKL